jgi:molybdopterin-guanine dinucleotide biosynthesis protein A
MRPPVTGGILAGGASSRMGENKALLSFRGAPLLLRQLGILGPLFEEVLLSAREEEPYRNFPCRIVLDRLPERCALSGLHALLGASRTEHVFAVACDLPFLSVPLIERLLGEREGNDVVIPESNGKLEPLYAVYSRACLGPIEECARRGVWKTTAFHSRVRVLRVPVREEDWTVEGRSPFLNLNTPGDVRAAGP